MTRFLILFFSLLSVSWAGTENGQRLYFESGGYGCAVCHGVAAHGGGQAGGYIRGASLTQINDSLTKSAPMQPLANVLSMQDRQDLSRYLAELSERPLVTLTFENGQWRGTAEPWLSGQRVDLVLYNATFETVEVDLTHLGGAQSLLAPLDSLTWQWQVTDLVQDLASFSTSFTQSDKP